MNSDAGGDYLYLYATVNSAAGEPISNLRVNNKVVSSTNNGFVESTVKRANNNGFTKEDPDLNDGAGGDYLYLIAKRAVSTKTTASIFSNGSLIAIFVLASTVAAVAVIVYIKKKKSNTHAAS